jgi:hypothetical protein
MSLRILDDCTIRASTKANLWVYTNCINTAVLQHALSHPLIDCNSRWSAR